MGIRCLRDFDVSGRVIQDLQQCLETVVAPWKSKFHQLHTVTQTVSNIHLVQSPDCDGRGVPGAPGDRLVDVHFNDVHMPADMAFVMSHSAIFGES